MNKRVVTITMIDKEGLGPVSYSFNVSPDTVFFISGLHVPDQGMIEELKLEAVKQLDNKMVVVSLKAFDA